VKQKNRPLASLLSTSKMWLIGRIGGKTDPPGRETSDRTVKENGEVIMGNTDKFEMIANVYDTPERIHIAQIASDAISEYLVDTKNKNAIDFGCGTGLVGMNFLNNLSSILF